MPEIDPKHQLRVYIEFLKIPEDQCHPNYYTLLGISKTIHDTAAIDEAAKRRSEELRRGLPAELHPAGRKILKRIAKARICLLDVDAKAAYDASIGLTTQVDQPSRAKARTASVRKSAKVAHNMPPSSPAPQTPSQGSNPPSHKPSPKQSSPEIDDFDDLLSGIPDVGAASTREPKDTGIKTGTIAAKPSSSTKSLPVVYATVGGIIVLGIVVAGQFLFSSGPDDQQASSEEVATNVPVDDQTESVNEPAPVNTKGLPPSNEPTRDVESTKQDEPTPEPTPEPTTEPKPEPTPEPAANIIPEQPLIPEFPLAKRINEDTAIAEYAISDGVLSVSITMPIPVNRAIPAFVVQNAYEDDDFRVSLEFNGTKSERDYFNVGGRAVKPKLFVDDTNVLQIKRNTTCKFLSPGNANLVIHFDGQEVRLPFVVTKIALPGSFGEKELVDLLGVPDRKETGSVSGRKRKTLDGELYKAEARGGGGSWDHWYYDKYPTLAFIPARHKIRHIFPE